MAREGDDPSALWKRAHLRQEGFEPDAVVWVHFDRVELGLAALVGPVQRPAQSVALQAVSHWQNSCTRKHAPPPPNTHDHYHGHNTHTLEHSYTNTGEGEGDHLWLPFLSSRRSTFSSETPKCSHVKRMWWSLPCDA